MTNFCLFTKNIYSKKKLDKKIDNKLLDKKKVKLKLIFGKTYDIARVPKSIKVRYVWLGRNRKKSDRVWFRVRSKKIIRFKNKWDKYWWFRKKKLALRLYNFNKKVDLVGTYRRVIIRNLVSDTWFKARYFKKTIIKFQILKEFYYKKYNVIIGRKKEYEIMIFYVVLKLFKKIVKMLLAKRIFEGRLIKINSVQKFKNRNKIKLKSNRNSNFKKITLMNYVKKITKKISLCDRKLYFFKLELFLIKIIEYEGFWVIVYNKKLRLKQILWKNPTVWKKNMTYKYKDPLYFKISVHSLTVSKALVILKFKRKWKLYYSIYNKLKILLGWSAVQLKKKYNRNIENSFKTKDFRYFRRSTFFIPMYRHTLERRDRRELWDMYYNNIFLRKSLGKAGVLNWIRSTFNVSVFRRDDTVGYAHELLLGKTEQSVQNLNLYINKIHQTLDGSLGLSIWDKKSIKYTNIKKFEWDFLKFFNLIEDRGIQEYFTAEANFYLEDWVRRNNLEKTLINLAFWIVQRWLYTCEVPTRLNFKNNYGLVVVSERHKFKPKKKDNKLLYKLKNDERLGLRWDILHLRTRKHVRRLSRKKKRWKRLRRERRKNYKLWKWQIEKLKMLKKENKWKKRAISDFLKIKSLYFGLKYTGIGVKAGLWVREGNKDWIKIRIFSKNLMNFKNIEKQQKQQPPLINNPTILYKSKFKERTINTRLRNLILYRIKLRLTNRIKSNSVVYNIWPSLSNGVIKIREHMRISKNTKSSLRKKLNKKKMNYVSFLLNL